MNPSHPDCHYSDEYCGGPYGRDGAPASNFMSFPAPAHHRPSPERPNIAPSECPLPPMDRYSSSSSNEPQTPPAYGRENPFPSSLEYKLTPPRAAFLEPASPTSHNLDSDMSYSLIYGQSEKLSPMDKSHASDPHWADLEHAKPKQSSHWLEKQSRAGSRFKIITWIFATIILIILSGFLAKIITAKSSPGSAPASFKWANGASEVPTFGRNSTNSNPTKT